MSQKLSWIIDLIKLILSLFRKKVSPEDVEKYSDEKKNQKFNYDLENSHDMNYCDALRKEKQQKVEEIKNA